MECFITGKPAKLLGVGLQSAGLSIPISNTTAKIFEGMRGCGLPVPPKTWFKTKNNKKNMASKQSKSVYDKFESHFNELIQVIKPSIKIKNLCVGYESDNHSRSERENMNHTMPKTKTAILLEPDAIIDLTKDDPNTVIRLSRCYEKEETLSKTAQKKQKINKKPDVINLDETIYLDDSCSNNINMTKQISLSKKSKNNKKSLSCPICLDSLSNENIKAMSTPCGHLYCLECLKAVIQTKSKCSICQRSIKLTKCIRLHI